MSTKHLASAILFVAGVTSAALAACGGGGPDNLFAGDHGGGGAAGEGGAAGDGGAGGAGGSAGAGGASGKCTSAAECADAFSCTIDACNGGVCVHVAGPSTGPTACPPSQFCDVLAGCVQGVACADTSQCVAKFGGDACKTQVTCDAASSVCTYQTLDKDGDGHPPPVCGGDDCNDNDPAVHPGASEACDGKDNDCDGKVDLGATCPGLAVCAGGACSCPPANACGGACVDKQTDGQNCGSCGNKCSSAAKCTAGTCVCSASATQCSGQCVDIASDPLNCNGCGNTCAPGYACLSGSCACTKTSCAGQCIDTQTDPNHCGGCGLACAPGTACVAGQCQCALGQSSCGGACVDTQTDAANCGSCGHVCPGGCQGGVCTTCTVADLYVLADISGSMANDFAAGTTTPTKLDALRTALGAFLTAPASANMGVGIGYWPLAGGLPTCTTNADCGASGLCLGGICLTGSTDSCTATDFATPGVGIAMLPGNASALTTSLASKAANGGSTPPAGLAGALAYAQTFAQSNPSHKVGVVAIADGLPNECNATLVTDLTPIAAQYAGGSPKVVTFVIGLPDATVVPKATWDQLASAGGTGSAYVASNGPAIQTALESIRASFKTCP